MPEDENRDGLRIGGWVPPYRDAAPHPIEPEARRGRPRRMPAFMRRRQPALADAPGLPPFDESGMDPTRRSRLVLAAAAGVVVAVIVGFALAGIRQAPPPQTPGSLEQPPPPAPIAVPSAAVSILPKPSPSPSRKPTSKPTPSKTKPKTTAPPRKTAPPPGVLVAGSTIGLEIAGYGGYRVEHDGPDVDVDRIDADADPDEKAAASFVVRKGLASPSCLSFEALDAPGHFLRHRDFELRLDERDGSTLFNQDATFCPQPSRDGPGVLLRSVNYPDRALSVRHGEIRLDDDSATTFEPRPPL
ncbi:hypothetical protein HH310_33745 [Actinoplanes sp. TBRC 11911]|uniref:AbfB domain-containing protein n=1 Tax=Actinoplanes sp. TBRC 11911 TaxID=2729386 RepID=UPI00145DDD5D|nr:AbfB domain-containing protein [Actinoplanes sp. TBRC 11911]NMO56130.1 hypothetical protein [Actinoplanes sp. TBRC 11911]